MARRPPDGISRVELEHLVAVHGSGPHPRLRRDAVGLWSDLQGPSGCDPPRPDGAIVTFAAAATDDSGQPPTVTCAPSSGSLFPIGSTAVTCTATDAAGNSATASFAVVVLGACQQMANLADKVLNSLGLPPAQ